MNASRPAYRPTIAACGLACALALSVGLACFGCTQNAAPETSNPASTETFVAPSKQFTVNEAEFTPPPPPEPEPEPEPEVIAHLATSKDILGLPSTETPFAFALAKNDEAPSLSSGHASAITSAVDVFTQYEWKSGYLLVDLETGRGVAGDLDERVFGASAIKGPFVHFLCEKWLDTGKASLEDEISVAGETMTLKEAIEDAIIKSGNDSYRTLFDLHSSGWRSWLSNLGIASEINSYQRNPYYTARESGVMWLEAYRYISAEGDAAGEHASWFASLIANTQVSFMRHAIGGGDVSVSNKAGWYATPEDSEYDMDGFCEAGIVVEGGHPYLLTVMTDAAYKGAIEDEFEDIIQAVWAARSDLAIEQA